MLADQIVRIRHRREVAAPLPTGISPQVWSSSFRTSDDVPSCTIKPNAKSLDHRLSHESRARQPSTLKSSTRSALPFAPINLGTARPNPQYSPWRSMTLSGQPTQGPDTAGVTALPGMTMICEQNEEGYDFGVAMNYGYAAGSPQLLRFITEHVEMVHDPPFRDWECCLTCGTTSALEIAFRMLCNPGDSILSELYTYPGAVEATKPLGVKMIGIRVDALGLVPEALDTCLKNWDMRAGPRPYVLYLIPSGQNPTGVTQSLERRRATYQVAEKYDLIIIEDDPYYFLQLKDHDSASTPDQYLKSLPSSFLSMDPSGRVLRLDSTSKILAPGLRCGWLTGSSQLVSQFLHHTEFSTVSPSGPSQVMLYKLLDEAWGHGGFVDWLRHLSSQLRRCRDALLQACRSHLPRPLCTWTVPDTGMFVWLCVDLLQHPLVAPEKCSEGKSVPHTVEHRIYEAARANGVQINKGSWFFVGDRPSRSSITFRMTFAAVTEPMISEGVRRFSEVLRSEFAIE